ncbi:hypothetical protein MJO29_013004 [Puccinia striiformis f. sp. tritici]|nr:hypothetical protein MJO29_013004 [Puccinia striiformis f. sp. tritici]
MATENFLGKDDLLSPPRRTATRPKGVLTSGVPTVADNFQKIDAKWPAETEQQETVVKTNPGRIEKDGIWHNVSLTEQEQEFLSEYVDGFPRTEKDLDKTIPEGSESVADIYNKMANSEDSRTDKEVIQDQNETISKLIQEMKEFKDSYQEMSRMFKEHSVAPQNVPIPATPNPRAIPSLRFATSTPRGERTYAMDTTIGAGDQSFLGTEVPSPDAEQSSQKPEIKLKEESTGVILDVKKTNLYFDGTDVESFLKRVEKTAKIHGAGAPDVAEQLPFILNNRKISEAMEQMEGHETANWELFKKELIRKWARATPLRRYREDAIPRLIQKTQENQGIKNHTEYKKFVGKLEEMIDYFVRMGYSHLNPESGDPLWRVMSTELKKEVTKELAHAKKLKKTKDGRIIVPDLEMLKEYVEISLIIVDFEDDIQEEAPPKESSKKSVKIKDPAGQEDSKEAVKKLTTPFDHQQRAPPPHFSRPSSPGFPDTRARYTPMECYYCGGKHAITTCDFYGPDLQERKVYRYQGMYYYPNRQPIVVENGMSVREMVQRYQEEQEKLSHTKSPAPEHTAGIAALEEWESWVPPQVNIDEDELQTNIGFGLRKSQRVQEKNQASGSQPAASKPQEPASKPPPPNQEALKAPSRRKSFPGSWMEEDVTEEEESITKNAGTKDSTPTARKNNQPSTEQTSGKGGSTNKLDKSIRNKFYKQTYTLTLEEIFSAIHNALVCNPPSGFNDAKIMATALQTYAAQNKNVAFSSLPAWEILRYLPKWRPDRPDLTIPIPTGETNASDEINIGDGSISGTGTVIRSSSPSSRSASSIDRAIGGKAAKKRRLESYSHAEMLTEASKFNSSSKERLTALKAANNILQQKNTITKEMIKIEEKKLALEERKFKVEEEHRQSETQMNEMKLLQENTDNINNPDTKQVLELMKKKIIGKWLPTS